MFVAAVVTVVVTAVFVVLVVVTAVFVVVTAVFVVVMLVVVVVVPVLVVVVVLKVGPVAVGASVIVTVAVAQTRTVAVPVLVPGPMTEPVPMGVSVARLVSVSSRSHKGERYYERYWRPPPGNPAERIPRVDTHGSLQATLTDMDQPDEAFSAEDRYVFQKLDEAHEQYEIYLSIKAGADIAALRELAELANTGTR